MFRSSGTVGQHTLSGVQSINIEILGASHTDFWYSDAKWADVQYGGKTAEQAAQLKARDQEINRKTSDFLQRIAATPDAEVFLSRIKSGVSFKDGKYTINLDEIAYND